MADNSILNFFKSIGLISLIIYLTLFYLLFRSIYRLYFSPISKFPGPRITALTSWYEVYYDVILGGQFTFKIRDLHDQYGMTTCLTDKQKTRLTIMNYRTYRTDQSS